MKRTSKQRALFNAAWNLNLSLEKAAGRIHLRLKTLQEWYEDEDFRAQVRQFERRLRSRNRLRLEQLRHRAIEQLAVLIDHPEQLKSSYHGEFLINNVKRGDLSEAAKRPQRHAAKDRPKPPPRLPPRLALPTDEKGKKIFQWLIRNERGDYREAGDQAGTPATMQPE